MAGPGNGGIDASRQELPHEGLESTQILKTERRPARVRKVPVKPTTQQIIRAFKQIPGYEEIIARIPKAATARGWDEGTQVAYFSVCGKTGPRSISISGIAITSTASPT
jgi:hypothetical protein